MLVNFLFLAITAIGFAEAATHTNGDTCDDSTGCCSNSSIFTTSRGNVNASEYIKCTDGCCGRVVVHDYESGYLIESYKPSYNFYCTADVLPLFPGEEMWSNTFRIILYGLALAYCFVGVAIVADKFMEAIEVITSQERQIIIQGQDGSKIPIKVMVWNPTIANLTLMALGSSAPEIILALLETVFTLDEPPSGGLGPSCIVGSAAFNLLAISSVCVVAVPDGEKRDIVKGGVFLTTAFFSVFAYLWIVIVLRDEIVSIIEAVLTFLLFALLVFIAYGFDKNWQFFGNSHQTVPLNAGSGKVQIEHDKAKLIEQLRKCLGEDISIKDLQELPEEQLALILAKQALKEKPKSRNFYRMQATKKLKGGRRLGLDNEKHIEEARATLLKAKGKGSITKESLVPEIRFVCTEYRVFENEQEVIVAIERTGGNLAEKSTVKFETANGTAYAGEDYLYKHGEVKFGPNETHQKLKVRIIDDNKFEPDEDFFIELKEPTVNCSISKETPKCRVIIINDDSPGQFSFETEHIRVIESEEKVALKLMRYNGIDGEVRIRYWTKDGCDSDKLEYGTAEAGKDYHETKAELVFAHGETERIISIPIVNNEMYERDECFTVEFELMNDGEYGEFKQIVVIIQSDDTVKGLVDGLSNILQLNVSSIGFGSGSYSEQFRDAMIVQGEDGAPPEVMDYVMHFISFGWKVLFAFIPPTSVWGGKATFFVSLALIGVITKFIEAIATIFGCTIGFSKLATAITVVAMGTSLPDTFASQQAAIQDDTADASVGNVTGSNSVNVFLGLGLPWLVGSIYKATKGEQYKVAAGSLVTSVIIFVACALLCLGVFFVRRKLGYGELGGPKTPKYISAVVFLSLWFVYIGLSLSLQHVVIKLS